MLFPESSVDPGFGVVLVLFRCFTHRFAFARLSDPYMTQSRSRLLTITFITMAFDHSNLWQFEASPYRAAPKGPPSSSVQQNAFASS